LRSDHAQPHGAVLTARNGGTVPGAANTAARNAQAAQSRKPAITATAMANNVAAQNQQKKAASAAPGHQPWYHWILP
jgi:hypothetical protein